MDIQFILDPYGCLSYIINYVNKGNRGMSKLLRQACDEESNGNISTKQKLNKIGSCFINASEISAQEAVYFILSMRLSQSSRVPVFINTSSIEKRAKMIKTTDILRKLEPNSTNIFVSGLIEHYCVRPSELEHTCLADFAANFDFSKHKKISKSKLDFDEDGDILAKDSAYSENKFDKVFQLQNKSGYVFKRQKEKIIRFVSYNHLDKINYYKEKLMLYHPWRTEYQNENFENLIYLRGTRILD